MANNKKKGKKKTKSKGKSSADVKHFGAKTYTDPKTGKKNTAF